MARSALAQATSFAHLIGFGRAPDPAPKAATEDDDSDELKQRDDESDEDYRKRMDERKAQKAAEGDKNDPAAADDTGNDDSDDKDQKDPQASAVRSRERSRCAAIFATSAAAKRPDMAAYFAFGTTMTRGAAVHALKAVVNGDRPAPKASEPAPAPAPAPAPTPSLGQRMAQEPRYTVGTEPEKPTVTGPEAFAAAVMAADRKRRGEKA